MMDGDAMIGSCFGDLPPVMLMKIDGETSYVDGYVVGTDYSLD